ncbi:MAG: AbrB/MazE/SpoVT family DNA-binding domain-containing protein [Rhizobacter sp.]|nr:AbrB/MazE/SpoVT family DNA-binding domain-containing protein [Chlorobiales bacterium]
METSVVTLKGQILIPAKMRKKHGLKNGTKVSVIDRGDEIVIKPVTREYFRQFAGAWGEDDKALKILMDERKKDRAKGK